MNLQNNEIIPNHIAMIMDGNGRWAQAKGLERTAGHEEGMRAVKKVARRASERGVKALTLFAFSTENWKRPVDEVRFIMNLPNRFFDEFMPEIKENNIKVTLTGFPGRVPSKTRRIIEKSAEETKSNDGLILNFAINYGSRLEIVDAVRKIADEVATGSVKPEEITEELLDQHLLTTQAIAPYQDVDLMIRTSGEERISNFLLWQNAYSEFYFSDLFWPDFDGDELDNAIASYQQRNRRYGGLN